VDDWFDGKETRESGGETFCLLVEFYSVSDALAEEGEFFKGLFASEFGAFEGFETGNDGADGKVVRHGLVE
jgi:hypothetical protein